LLLYAMGSLLAASKQPDGATVSSLLLVLSIENRPSVRPGGTLEETSYGI
jgi:hypothetical protein